MAQVVQHHQDIKADMEKATSKFCEAQHKLWQAEFRAKRYGTKPSRAVVQAYMQAQADIDALSVEQRTMSDEVEAPFPRPPSPV